MLYRLSVTQNRSRHCEVKQPRLEGKCRLHLQRWTRVISHARNRNEAGSKPTPCLLDGGDMFLRNFGWLKTDIFITWEPQVLHTLPSFTCSGSQTAETFAAEGALVLTRVTFNTAAQRLWIRKGNVNAVFQIVLRNMLHSSDGRGCEDYGLTGHNIASFRSVHKCHSFDRTCCLSCQAGRDEP
jgi:hypothetical protein